VDPDRRLRLTYDDLDELAARARPENPKLHDLAALDASFERFGFITPAVVNDTDDLLLEAHGRIEALLTLKASGAPPPPGIQTGPRGQWLIPTVHGIHLSPDDAAAFVIAANRIGELGGWDQAKLADLLSELNRSSSGLAAVGFSEADLSRLLEKLDVDWSAGQRDPDEVPEAPPQDALYVKRGQLWRLDHHRLLCGDATRHDDVNRLLSGRRADMAVTDPPYNVNYGASSSARRRPRRRTLANDDLTPPSWEAFVRRWAHHVVTSVDGGLYVFMSSKEWPSVSRLLEEAGGHWSDTIIWAKDRFVLGRADYQRQYEPIWYGWRKGSRHYWCQDRAQGDVWLIPRPAASDLHPTMKPVALVERAIANSSSPGARVLDLFLGSGTTLIACERLSRRCIGMELEPLYVQVAIERWQRYTGRVAVLEEE
jgi:DNA modification methylase